MIRQLVLLKLGLLSLTILFWWGGEIGSAKESLVEVAPHTPVWQVGVSPELPGVSYVVVDPVSKAVILAQAKRELRPLASVTKLLAVCQLNTQHDLAMEKITITPADLEGLGRAGRLSVGEVYTAYELLFPLLLESSNDAAAALERQLGDELAEMNDQLKSYEITLADYSGLSDNNQGSPEGVARAMIDCLNRDRHLFDMTRLKTRVGDYVTWSNNSPVLGAAYRGGKHGYTEAAGRTLAALIEESTPSQDTARELVYVILGSENLALDLERLRSAVQTTARFE